jgi:hypothetical protein
MGLGGEPSPHDAAVGQRKRSTPGRSGKKTGLGCPSARTVFTTMFGLSAPTVGCPGPNGRSSTSTRSSPPGSTRTNVHGSKSASRSSTALRLAVMSSRIAVCGQAPVRLLPGPRAEPV